MFFPEKLYNYKMLKIIREQSRKRKAAWRAKYPEKDMLANARIRAREKDLPFSISYKDIKIPALCPVLNIPLERGVGVSHDNSPSLDRITPDKGYVLGNIKVISYRANRIKSNATNEELVAVAKYICKNLKA